MSSSAMSLVDRRLDGDRRRAFLERSDAAPRVDIDDDQVLDCERIADGSFSPLEGFMGRDDLASVLERSRLADGRPFSLPILLQVPATRSLPHHGDLLLWNGRDQRPCALMEIRENFPLDLPDVIRRTFGTDDPAHPGVAKMQTKGSRAVSGELWLLGSSRPTLPTRYLADPQTVRQRIADRGFRTVVGFQTRNLAHRAHERLQKIGLELTDGLLIHPLVGWKKPGDVRPEVLLAGYEILISTYYPEARTLLYALSTAMRYAGPREAVFHALIRRNYGCTHFIVGRDHAGVGGYYAKYAAHSAFDAFTPEELGITPLRLHGPSFCRRCAEMVTEATCPHGGDAWRDISGTDIRAIVKRGESPDEQLMRPEVAAFLVRMASEGRAFFEA